MKNLFLSIIIFINIPFLQGQTTEQKYLEYIKQFSGIAQRQQQKFNIPASIILAQGLLESGAGLSRLTLLGNNHFGIKCHDWKGEKIYHDDDEKNECFRKYNHAEESFDDHSAFLTSRPRYKTLFNLNPTDYAGWAHGLKAAGYATDPSYAQKLINLIERFQLYQYDQVNYSATLPGVQNKHNLQQNSTSIHHTGLRNIYKSNYINIIVATEKDSYETLSKELNISESKLRRYNDAPATMNLTAGDIVYLKSKKRKAACPNKIHVVKTGETLYSISQVYGIKLLSLYKLNELPFTEPAKTGQILKLR
jgi:LysM repeat protein